MRILVVEDDARVREVVTSSLTKSGHAATTAQNVGDALAAIDGQPPELAIVDVGLPDGSGLDLCRQLRASGHEFPILLLTAHSAVEDRVSGLDAGADDYLGKPFSTVELSARVRALGRRGPRFHEAKRAFENVEIDRERRTVQLSGRPVAFTTREFDIVVLLAWRDGRVLSRDELLESVWGDVSKGAEASLEVLMTRIRRKLSPLEAVRTIRSVGYAWALERSKPH